MNKYIILFLYLITILNYSKISALSEEPYYQDVYEKYIITVNTGIQASIRFDEYGCNLQLYPSIPINLDIFYRFTSANIFGYSGVLVELPFFNTNLAENLYGSVFIGLGWYVFDHRTSSGLGWSMLMAFAGGFYVMNDHLGGGVRLASRMNYSFHKNLAFNIGLDFDYAAVQFHEIRNGFDSRPTYNILNLGINFGFTLFI